MRNRWVTAGAATVTLGAAALASALPAGAATGHSQGGRVQLRNSTPQWAHGRANGAQSAAAPVQVQVYLAPRGGDAALDAAVADVSDPASSQYHHFLTPDQYRGQFEPTDAEVAAVSNWLRSAGLVVDGVEGSHRFVSAHGTAAAAQSAFGVRINRYTRSNQQVQAADRDLSVPDSVASAVEGVTGLDTAPVVMKPNSFPPPPAFVNARPCSKFFGQVTATYQADFKTPLPAFGGSHPAYAVCGYTPPQLQVAYGTAASKLTGKGLTVGIVDAFASPTIRQDADTYASRNGNSTFASGQFTQSNASSFHFDPKVCQTPGSWAGEETLDVESSHALAPAAGVRYYGARSCVDTDLRVAMARAVDQNKVSVISNSYGSPEEAETAGGVHAWQQVFKQAALQGITVLFSSGDNGDELATTGLRQADYPASDPNVTAVGGTSTAIGPNGQITWQTGWGTDKFSLSANGKSWQPLGFLYGAGGGYSGLFNRPSYQNGVVAANQSGRAVPDVALDADPTTGMLLGITQQFPNGVHYGEYRIGGTSLASPLMAGMVAMAGQHAGSRLGFLNPAIYQLAKSGSGAFTDVVPNHTGQGNVRADYANSVDASQGILYSVRTFDQDSSLFTSKGWDDVTGLGVPSLGFLGAFSK